MQGIKYKYIISKMRLAHCAITMWAIKGQSVGMKWKGLGGVCV